jgi:hypothetical protein
MTGLQKIRITKEYLHNWPKVAALVKNGGAKFDSVGRLRYLHGAPVGDMIFIRKNKDGTLIYQESAEEWFDPETQKAKDFIWE